MTDMRIKINKALDSAYKKHPGSQLTFLVCSACPTAIKIADN